MGNIINDRKILIFTKESDANSMVDKFKKNYTAVIKSSDGKRFGVYIKCIDRHVLTQKERDSMVEFPEDFYGD